MECAICRKKFKRNDTATIRESWSQAGGFGGIPLCARVHPECDEEEQRLIEQGKIKIDYFKNNCKITHFYK